MVFQAYNLFPHLDVLANCTLAPRLVHGVGMAAATDRAMTLLTRFGLADKAAAHPDSLSGGQQQRVALVRALCTDPQVLLLDEITAALDPMLVGEVLDTLRMLASEGMTMICVTHEMKFAREVSDRVAFFHKGVMAEIAPPAELFGNPKDPNLQQFLAATH